jgi:hypothetical protein
LSTKINLEFVIKKFHPDVEGLPELREVIRIQGRIRFKTEEGYGEPEKAIIDTGAPISLIPFDMWRHMEIEYIGEDYLRGVVPNEKCYLPADVGRIKAVLTDKNENTSDELIFLAYLSFTNKIPLIIGIMELMEKGILCLDFKNRNGYIEL